jgi:hypothetical protein
MNYAGFDRLHPHLNVDIWSILRTRPGWLNFPLSSSIRPWNSNVAKMDEINFKTYIELCGLCLARAHARTWNSSAIAGYLGNGKSFDTAVANFAMTYADQTERDYQLLVEAVDSGKIVASKGI